MTATQAGPASGTSPEPGSSQHIERPLSTKARIGSGVFVALLGVVVLFPLGLSLDAGSRAHLQLGPATGPAHLPDLVLPGLATGVVIGIVLLGLAAWQLVRGFRSSRLMWLVGGSLGLFMLAFLSWVSAHGDGVRVDLLGLLQNSIGLSVPLILGALAGLLCERSGVINVAIEGQMLAGAWGGALFGTLLGTWVGLVGAAAAGAIMGSILALFSIRYLVNQVVLGVVLNVFALGLTGFFYDAFMQQNPDRLNLPQVFKPFDIPLLSDIPLIGPLFFQANVVVYLTYVLVVVIDVALFRTRWGLRTRAIGEHPKAADTVGITGAGDALPQRDPRWSGRGPGRRVLHHRLGRRLRQEHHLRQRLHRPRRGDLRSLEPAGCGRRCPAVRLRLGAADAALDHRALDPVELPRDAALPGDHLRRRRTGRPGARSGGRR